jgi:transcriptional regulator with XRE-family HTH domain
MERARRGEELEILGLRVRFGEQVRAARIKAGLTQAQLAERLGRSQKYVSLIETGGRRLPIDAMMLIMRALGLVLEIGTRPLGAEPQD